MAFRRDVPPRWPGRRARAVKNPGGLGSAHASHPIPTAAAYASPLVEGAGITPSRRARVVWRGGAASSRRHGAARAGGRVYPNAREHRKSDPMVSRLRAGRPDSTKSFGTRPPLGRVTVARRWTDSIQLDVDQLCYVVLAQDEGADCRTVGTDLRLTSRTLFDWLDEEVETTEPTTKRAATPPAQTTHETGSGLRTMPRQGKSLRKFRERKQHRSSICMRPFLSYNKYGNERLRVSVCVVRMDDNPYFEYSNML